MLIGFIVHEIRPRWGRASEREINFYTHANPLDSWIFLLIKMKLK